MSQSKTEPTVCAILLTADRPHLARRAVESFRSQTYPAKRLLIWDNGPCDALSQEDDGEDGPVAWVPMMSAHGATIGELRNEAASFWTENPILLHWDDDDYSHPNRIAEQVALLQSSGADCVGYREMLFWQEKIPGKIGIEPGINQMERPGEAWLYSNRDPRYCLGTSLCYWRKTWERKPFEATSQGEDERFTTGLKCVGISTLPGPLMIARIHAGNTSNAYDPADMWKASEWKRVPEWDSHARLIMEGK